MIKTKYYNLSRYKESINHKSSVDGRFIILEQQDYENDRMVYHVVDSAKQLKVGHYENLFWEEGIAVCNDKGTAFFIANVLNKYDNEVKI